MSLNPDSNPFPGFDPNPTIARQTVKFVTLLDQDRCELKKLVQACEADGFFYLDLSDRGSQKLFDDLESLSIFIKEWLNQPREKQCETITSKTAPLLCHENHDFTIQVN
jgi:hypothetical protein